MKRVLNKKSQIAVFIILGILIVSIISWLGYVIKTQADAKLNEDFFSQEEIKVQVDNIQMNIFMCLDGIGLSALETIGDQGGYYNKPLEYLEMDLGFVPYYYHQGDYSMPSNEDITNELKNYVNDNLGDCLNGLMFDNFELSHGNIESNVVINSASVLFEADVDVKIEREGRNIVFELKENPVTIESSLKDILEIAEYITESHKEDSKMYCISCVEEMAEERDVYVQTTDLGDNSLLIIIGENRTADEPYLFSFANKYTGEEISDDFKLTGAEAESLPGSV